MSDMQFELNEKQKELVQKYTYFLLAAAGAAIGFSLQRTDTVSWGLHLLPLGGAVLLWGLSFYFGCRFIHRTRDSNWANIVTIKMISERGKSQSHIDYIKEIGENKFLKLSGRAGINSSRQFYFFVFGVIFFIIWHVLEIYLKSSPNTCLSRYLLN